MKTRTRIAVLYQALLALIGCASIPLAVAAGVQRLYVLDCGESKVPDISPWTAGIDSGQSAVFSNNCYLIRHGKDWMLWDSGFPDAIAALPDGVAGPRNMRGYRSQTLVSQMATIGVTPDKVNHLAFSHEHGDHVGNANLFTLATLYMQQAEYDAAFGPSPERYGFNPANYGKLRASKVVKLNGDYDVFGDGSVRILSTPGHTPGHQSLLVHLPKTGAVVLSGDAAHFWDNFTNRRVPNFNFDADQSRQSMDKLDAVVKSEHAQLWINHDVKQNATILHAPKYYD
jgi:glyoxylase-like metal-dependent hydrolase (beta-lactamase superfamily II)